MQNLKNGLKDTGSFIVALDPDNTMLQRPLEMNDVRGLSQRSLALECLTWESTRLSFLAAKAWIVHARDMKSRVGGICIWSGKRLTFERAQASPNKQAKPKLIGTSQSC